MNRISHEDKIEARRLFLSLSKGRSAWADTRGTIIRGEKLADLRLRAVHELINLSTGPKDREDMQLSRNATDWSNTAQLIRGRVRSGEPEVEVLKALWMSSLAGTDHDASSRSRIMRRVVEKFMPESSERYSLGKTIDHHRELRCRSESMINKGMVTKAEIEANGEVAPKGSRVQVNGYGAIWIDIGGERLSLTRDEVRPMRKRDRSRLKLRMEAINEAGDLTF